MLVIHSRPLLQHMEQWVTQHVPPCATSLQMSVVLSVFAAFYYTVIQQEPATMEKWVLGPLILLLLQMCMYPQSLLSFHPFMICLCPILMFMYHWIQMCLYSSLATWSWDLRFPSEQKPHLLLVLVILHLASLILQGETRSDRIRRLGKVLLGTILLILWNGKAVGFIHFHHYLYGMVMLALVEGNPGMYGTLNQMLGVVFLLDGIWIYGPTAFWKD